MDILKLSQKHKIVFTFLAAVITLLCYSNHFHNPFEFDDEHTISSNEHIRSLKNIPSFFVDATTTSSLPQSQAYRPGLTTLNSIDYFIGGEELPNPFYYHVSIFISYILLGLFFLAVCQKILTVYFEKNTAFVFSLCTTLLLWLHTANTATVNYIITIS